MPRFIGATVIATALLFLSLKIPAYYVDDVTVFLLFLFLLVLIAWDRHRRKLETLYQRRATETEVLRRSEELKSAVLDAVAHEIRSPLNSIKIAVTALLSGTQGMLNSRELLAIIEEEVDRMDQSIDQAVQLARIEAGELLLRKEPQDIELLIRTAISEMGSQAPSREVHVLVDASLPAPECDRRLLLRVLKQLLNNAFKYSPEGSPLIVSAEFVGREVIIGVIDQGPGVEVDERERIFEKYYRGRAARSRSSGDGLGLASAKCIVEAHGGRIWVRNPPEGGSAFHFSLPASSVSQPKGAA